VVVVTVITAMIIPAIIPMVAAIIAMPARAIVVRRRQAGRQGHRSRRGQ
jgi:hypothetical protein